MNDPADAVDRLLPQTQCGACGYSGCLPYARAIVDGAPMDRCPPGGVDTIRALARLLGREEIPLAADLPPYAGPSVAVIDEERCIGCARCLPACPVDAIVGASKWLHTVIREGCTGCGLCLPPCPVDCIEMIGVPSREPLEQQRHADVSRLRHRAHEKRAAVALEAAAERRRGRRAAHRSRCETDRSDSTDS